MPRPDRSKKAPIGSPVDAKKREVQEREARIRAELDKARRFLDDAPRKKAEVERRQREELLQRSARVSRIDGPVDHRRLNNVTNAQAKPQRRLRKERNHDQLMFFFLLTLFVIVIYWACNKLMHG